MSELGWVGEIGFVCERESTWPAIRSVRLTGIFDGGKGEEEKLTNVVRDFGHLNDPLKGGDEKLVTNDSKSHEHVQHADHV